MNFWSSLKEFVHNKILEHRESTRAQIRAVEFNLATVLSVIPFLLGFYYFLDKKYPTDKKILFFAKNFPVISPPIEKMNWDTFQYFWKNSNKANFQKSRLFWADRNLYIETPINNFMFGPTEEQLIAYIQKDDSNGHAEIKPKWYEFTIQKNQIHNDNLDEIPKKLKGFEFTSINEMVPDLQPFFDMDFDKNSDENSDEEAFEEFLTQMINTNIVRENENTLISRTKKTDKIEKESVPSTEKSPFLDNSVIQNWETGSILSNGPQSNTISFVKLPVLEMEFDPLKLKAIYRIKTTRASLGHKEFFDSFAHQLYKNFAHNKKVLDSELRRIFQENGLVPLFTSSSINSEKSLSEYLSEHLTEDRTVNGENIILDDIFPIEMSVNEELDFFKELISDLDTVELSEPSKNTRLMSGYIYPDMTLKDLVLFRQQLKSSLKKYVKIDIPPSFLKNQLSDFYMEEPPSISIRTKKKKMRFPEFTYGGPSLDLDPNTGFDWKIHSDEDVEEYRAWLDLNLGSQNPFTNDIWDFDGVESSPEGKNREYTERDAKRKFAPKPTKKNNLVYWIKNLPLFTEDDGLTNDALSFLPFERVFAVPHVKFDDTSPGYMCFTEIPLPLVETRVPEDIDPETIYSYDNSLEFTFSPPVEVTANLHKLQKNRAKQRTENTPIQLGFTQSNLFALTQDSFGETYSSGSYKRVISVFNQRPTIKSKAIFVDLWEPLTFQSWFFTCQMGYAFIVFKILKSLADNYGKELLVYLLDLVALLGFLDDELRQEIEMLMGQREKGFRIIEQTTKTFQDIAGVQGMLPDIVEIVWFLRNAGRSFNFSNTIPRGLLLTGPPGTGKTLLVQAIAGEAGVPVLALAGSSLLDPNDSGAIKLQLLFDEARRLAPCIVFIDEVDSIAQKREQVLVDIFGDDDFLDKIAPNNEARIREPIVTTNYEFSESTNENEIENELYIQQHLHREKLRILMQFLVELDGVKRRDGVIVIGATNRPEVLDPAILRPGRFDKTFELGLPTSEKRREILELYGKNLGIDKNISWEYLIHRTNGYSAADLASIMNQSTLRAILTDSFHNLQTIEHGIDRITTVTFENPIEYRKDTASTIQFAYYQAGKILLGTLLDHHPETVVSHLWPRRLNPRAIQIGLNLQKYIFKLAHLAELEDRLVGCYAGKAAEILFLQDANLLVNLSEHGLEDLQFGQSLVEALIVNWNFYTKTIVPQKGTEILDDYHKKEYPESPEVVSLMANIEREASNRIDFVKYFFPDEAEEDEDAIKEPWQDFLQTKYWQSEISKEFQYSWRTFATWYRIYLPDPVTTLWNIEWIPPDIYYNGNDITKTISKNVHWNDLAQIRTEYIKHSLILESFNKALVLIDQNREVLDVLAYELLNREVLREPEIRLILKKFNITKKQIEDSDRLPDKLEDVHVIAKSWGKNSRRPKSRSIDVKAILEQILEED